MQSPEIRPNPHYRKVTPTTEPEEFGTRAKYDADLKYGEPITRFSEKEKAKVAVQIEKIWASLGINMKFDWSRVRLLESSKEYNLRAAMFLGVKKETGEYGQTEKGAEIYLPHYWGGWFLPRAIDKMWHMSKRQALSRLRHEAIHSCGRAMLVEESWKEEFEEYVVENNYDAPEKIKFEVKGMNRFQKSGLLTWIRKTGEKGQESRRPVVFGHLLNEAFTSTINGDSAYPASKRLFEIILKELSVYSIQVGDGLSRHDILKLFAKSYFYNYDQKIKKLLVGRFGKAGFKLLMNLNAVWYEEEYRKPKKQNSKICQTVESFFRGEFKNFTKYEIKDEKDLFSVVDQMTDRFYQAPINKGSL